jgi:hypothetical protein
VQEPEFADYDVRVAGLTGEVLGVERLKSGLRSHESYDLAEYEFNRPKLFNGRAMLAYCGRFRFTFSSSYERWV